MPNYRRRRVPGGTYFFTVNLADPEDGTLCVEIDLLRECYAKMRQECPFRTDAIVVLPNHLHAIWTLPEGDTDYSGRWRRLKGRFSHALRRTGARSASAVRKRETGIWQRRFWEHTIRDADDLRRHLEYCWFDPVRHGLVHDPSDWAFSSFVKRGMPIVQHSYRAAMPIMRYPVGERDERQSKGGRIPRPASAVAT